MYCVLVVLGGVGNYICKTKKTLLVFFPPPLPTPASPHRPYIIVSPLVVIYSTRPSFLLPSSLTPIGCALKHHRQPCFCMRFRAVAAL